MEKRIDSLFAKKERELKRAMARSKALPDEVVPGKILSFHVADGYAYYEITDVSKHKAYLEWRDYIDGYMEPILGPGMELPIKKVKELVKREYGWRHAVGDR